jgi:hypothetical protein
MRMTETEPLSGPPLHSGDTGESAPAPLGSLLRKAAVDAGFDLEPEIDSGWWRLRASGASGVAWVRPLVDAPGAWLALSVAAQLVAIDVAQVNIGSPPTPPVLLPPGAAAAVSCPTPNALHNALRRLWTLRAHAPERLRARWEAGVAAALAPSPGVIGDTAIPPATEVVAEVRRRVGQELYREALLDFWEGRCAVTGLAVPELLRASHAKPWADATDTERLDVHNGLLLAVHLDALFDRGFLTFDEAGQGTLSHALPPDARALLGVSEETLRLRRVHAAHRPYLAWHRQYVFRA